MFFFYRLKWRSWGSRLSRPWYLTNILCVGGGFISIPVCSEVDVDVDGPGSWVSVGSGLDVLDDGWEDVVSWLSLSAMRGVHPSSSRSFWSYDILKSIGYSHSDSGLLKRKECQVSDKLFTIFFFFFKQDGSLAFLSLQPPKECVLNINRRFCLQTLLWELSERGKA